jgi:hypothetical protein
MNKYISRLTSSARGELFNPLIYPSLMMTLIYGIGFVFLRHTGGVAESSLFTAMTTIGGFIPLAWGIACLLTIVVGIFFLLLNKPPAGRFSGIMGFAVWVFASFCWGLTGGWFLVLALGIPNMWFWIWQYLSLARFNREDADDEHEVLDQHG